MKPYLKFLLLILLSFQAMAAPKVVLIHGEKYYGSEKTVPALAKQLTETFGYETTVLGVAADSRALPDLSALAEADLLVLYIRLREATETQLAQLNAYLDAGKPAIALRTSSHGIANERGWFVPHFGGHFKTHTAKKKACQAMAPPEALGHPILKDVPPRFSAGDDGIYYTLPLSEGTQPILFGRVGEAPTQPLAWTMHSNRFYTSLGSETDFENKAFTKMLLNACHWCLEKPTNPTAKPPIAPEAPTHALAADEAAISTDAWRYWDPSMLPATFTFDAVADTGLGRARSRDARWQVDGSTLVARPGYGDVLANESFGDAVYHMHFLLSEDADADSGVFIDGKWKIQLNNTASCGAIHGVAEPTSDARRQAGTWQSLRVAVQHIDKNTADLSVWLNDTQIHERVRVDEPTPYGFPNERSEDDEEESEAPVAAFTSAEAQGMQCDMGKDFTAIIRFRTEGNGTLFSKLSPDGKHRENDKVLFISEGRVHYDIGWLGVVDADKEVTNGDWHTAALRSKDGLAEIFIDGEKLGDQQPFTAPDNAGGVIRIGAGANEFPEGEEGHWEGEFESFQFFAEALSDQDLELTESSEPIERVKSVLAWKAEDSEEEEQDDVVVGQPLRLQANFGRTRFANITVRPLADVDHASIITAWDDSALKRGEKIYQGICFACHGNLEKKGSLPTSRPFWKEPFKNGKDPHSLYLTMKKGYNQMPAQPWLTPSAAYDVIHYIREEFVKPNNPSEYVDMTPAYLASLPKGMGTQGTLTEEQIDYAKGPKYERMNFGPMLDWTYEVAPGNIAYKGIAIRLDEGPGGVSKGRHWMVYDHDTMRVAAAWSGNKFVDWKGIAFDQSHGTHTSIVGDKTLVNPVGPGWANPANGSWADPRFLGRDGKPYGPLPREWSHFKGQYVHGSKVVIHYTVGDATVLELPSLVQADPEPVFMRTFNISKSSQDMHLRVSPSGVTAQVLGGGAATVEVKDGYQVMTVLAKDTPIKINLISSKADAQNLVVAALLASEAEDLTPYLKGGPTQWTETVTTQGKMGNDSDAFAVDEITYPNENPYHSWMRIGGFDFLPGGKRAAVATWLGDVWLVDDVGGDFKEHRWKRICTGLFQPLGVKWVDGHIYVTCRDQLAKLHDFNGDEEIDYVESFNNDHQVTEHFHEFAMGLQTDDAGNFYYAKSARHAKTALVPHHGTLLRVSKDGSTTEILATGFRAANGVCLNPDGTYIVTDQEGHWNPKNRINYVKEGGFYGNMYGYHDVTDTSDAAMEQPLCWITNAFDRSPGELLWVPEDAKWGGLNGKLLNLSYGTGKVFAVPHEKMPNGQAQGGMVSIGLDFPTGIMRGRFHPDNGQLYTTGMFAWAGSKHQDGGFYRIRATGNAKNLPIELKARPEGIQLGFTDPLDKEDAVKPENYEIKVWALKRTKNYGSKHHDEKPLKVDAVTVSEDGKTVFLSIPNIATTWCMEIKIHLRDANGQEVERVIHNTIHQLGETKEQTYLRPKAEEEDLPPKQAEVDHTEPRAHVIGLLETHCIECHDSDNSKGDLDIESALLESPLVKSRDLWINVLERLKNKEMPPEDEPQPSEAEYAAMADWINHTVIDFDYTKVKNPGYEGARRLSHAEYNHTLRDLFGIDLRPADKFPHDLSGTSGFANSANTLFIQPTLLERYIGAAEEVVTAAIPNWPLAKETDPNKLFPTFLRRAYRRPPTETEVGEFTARYERAKAAGSSHIEALQPALVYALISPHFLFRLEGAPADEADHRITDWELASRLSYYLWSSMPDDTLLDLAATGTLSNPDTLRKQVQRMLADDRSAALGHEFASQWLKFEYVGTRVRLDPIDNPWCTDTLMSAMRQESAMFIHSLIQENRPIHNLINGNYTFLNEELANHYRIPGIQGDHMRRVTLNNPRRGGIFGHGSVLAVTSFPGRTSPVVRGKYILADVLGTPPPPPPPDAGELDEEVARKRNLTLKEKLEIHRGAPQCAGCHAKIDPLGFSLENYDWFGRYREEHQGKPVDSEGMLPNGHKFRGLEGLREVIIDQRLDDLTRQLTRKMLSFGLGRQLEYYDELAAQQIVAAVKKDGYHFHSLINEIVHSYPFQWKRLPKAK